MTFHEFPKKAKSFWEIFGLAIGQFPVFRLRLRAKEGVSNKAARDLRRLARC